MRLYILLFLIPFNVYGLELHLENGQTTTYMANPNHFTDAKYSAITMRAGDNLYIEPILAAWQGESNGRFYGASMGLRSSGKWFVEGSIGHVQLVEEIDQLEGLNQYLLTVGLGFKYENFIISYKYRHLSNGHQNDKNHGLDFKILSFGVLF